MFSKQLEHRRLAYCCVTSSLPTVGFNMKKVQKGHVTLKWYGGAAATTKRIVLTVDA